MSLTLSGKISNLSFDGTRVHILIDLENGNKPAAPLPMPGEVIPMKELELSHIKAVLQSTKTLSEASQILGMNVSTLWRKRKQLGLN